MNKWIPASEVNEGDVISFNDGSRVEVERLSASSFDGAIGIHGNNETWSSWYKPTDRVRVEAKEQAAF